MKKTIIIIGLIILVLSILGCAKPETEVQPVVKLENHVLDFPYEEISDSEIEALSLAINDEYKARATYRKVIVKFGSVRPFANIMKAEEIHINELKNIYEKYGLTIPEDEWYEVVPEFDSLGEACKAGVEAEVENAALYDELFSKVDNQDITAVFTALRDASKNNHLPAFARCGGS
ncbi:DUF2202 domain-containing protein [Candidatus Woesearchaeota archaeon]|nr:DUF2202 domain-containing protein [Candidatus Woesearchaeota archaeon]